MSPVLILSAQLHGGSKETLRSLAARWDTSEGCFLTPGSLTQVYHSLSVCCKLKVDSRAVPLLYFLHLISPFSSFSFILLLRLEPCPSSGAWLIPLRLWSADTSSAGISRQWQIEDNISADSARQSSAGLATAMAVKEWCILGWILLPLTSVLCFTCLHWCRREDAGVFRWCETP